MKTKILQIIPAQGLIAVYEGDEPAADGEPGKAFTEPVIAFALCEVQDARGTFSQEVKAMTLEGGTDCLGFPGNNINFIGINHDNAGGNFVPLGYGMV